MGTVTGNGAQLANGLPVSGLSIAIGPSSTEGVCEELALRTVVPFFLRVDAVRKCHRDRCFDIPEGNFKAGYYPRKMVGTNELDCAAPHFFRGVLEANGARPEHPRKRGWVVTRRRREPPDPKAG